MIFGCHSNAVQPTVNVGKTMNNLSYGSRLTGRDLLISFEDKTGFVTVARQCLVSCTKRSHLHDGD